MTALMAWPSFHREMEKEVDNQVAAPAETRTPNLHRAKKSLLESADGRVATGLFWGREGRRGRTTTREERPRVPQRRPPSFLAEWWQSGPRRQGFADAAQNAPLTAPGRSANPPLGRKVDFKEGKIKIYLTGTGILMEGHYAQDPQ